MKVLFLIICIILWLFTLLIAIQPYCDELLASYLHFFTLFILPVTIFNIVAFVFQIYTKNVLRYPHAFIIVISLYLMNNNFKFLTTDSDKKIQNKICIISCNVENFQIDKKILYNSVFSLCNLDPDIICLQERPHNNLLSFDTIRRRFSFTCSAINNREDEVLNLAVFSKWPLLNKKDYYFADSYNKFFQIDILHPNGIIRLFNVHLQTTGIIWNSPTNSILQYCKNVWNRNLQADKLSECIKQSPYPVIVCGDFNDTPLSYAYKKVADQLVDCFKEAGPCWGGTYQPLGNMFRIDYILSSSEFNIKKYQLINNPWSDHKIQVSELQFTKLDKK